MDKETVMELAPRLMDEDAGAVGLADATRASTMMAMVQRRYGVPDVLEYTAVAMPVVGDDDVLVRVHAAAVHPGDYFLMTGVPYVVRLAFGLRRPRNGIRGMDLAGRIQLEAFSKPAARNQALRPPAAARSGATSKIERALELRGRGEADARLRAGRLRQDDAAGRVAGGHSGR
ncbi:MAG: hypothetical protein IT340_12640 [Chloroflexi bacterium]|nr:hypothetical protein [Chloroflexota bacterium]